MNIIHRLTWRIRIFVVDILVFLYPQNNSTIRKEY